MSRDPNKVVLTESLQHPLTLFPSAVGFLGTLSVALFGASPVLGSIALGGFTIGASSLAYQYFFRGESISSALLRKQSEELKRRKAEILRDLDTILLTNEKNAKQSPTAREYAAQANTQLDLVNDSYENYSKLLSQRLQTSEISYTRYAVTGEQVYLSVLDNLHSVASRLESTKSIDRDYCQTRLESLAQQAMRAPLNKADTEEENTLKRRLEVEETQLDKINDLLTENEKALTEFGQANASLVEMKTIGASSSSGELEFALKDLSDLAERAKKFASLPKH